MTAVEKGDAVVERVAERMRAAAERLAADGGAKAKLAETLAEDAAFVRQLKPSLIRARIKGEAPATGITPAASEERAGLTTFGEQPPKPRTEGGGPNPIVVVAAAFAAGIVIAKVIDWRGHAHPRF